MGGLKSALNSNKTSVLTKAAAFNEARHVASLVGVDDSAIETTVTQMNTQIDQRIAAARSDLGMNMSRSLEQYKGIFEAIKACRKYRSGGNEEARQVQDLFAKHAQGLYEKKDVSNLEGVLQFVEVSDASLRAWAADMHTLRKAESLKETDRPDAQTIEMYNAALERVKSYAVPASLDIVSLKSTLRSIALSHLKETQIGQKKGAIEAAIAQAVAAGVPEAEINAARNILQGGPSPGGYGAPTPRADL